MKIAIIPARGGSKRIPKKNIKLFAGEPIIAYSIRTAIDSGLFDRVIVSTEDRDIAEVAQIFGAEVPFLRPESLADDYTGTNAVVKHATEWVNTQCTPVDYVCCIYPTAPFLQVKYLHEAFVMLTNSGRSFVFSAAEYPFPIQRAIRISAAGGVEPICPECINKRSQDLEKVYHDAGQFYWGTAKAFLHDEATFSDNSLPIILPRSMVHDIDELEDWKRAELMYHIKEGFLHH